MVASGLDRKVKPSDVSMSAVIPTNSETTPDGLPLFMLTVIWTTLKPTCVTTRDVPTFAAKAAGSLPTTLAVSPNAFSAELSGGASPPCLYPQENAHCHICITHVVSHRQLLIGVRDLKLQIDK